MDRKNANATLPSKNQRAAIDVCERLAEEKEWSFEREDRDSLLIGVQGTSCEYQLAFLWDEELEALQLVCTIRFVVPDGHAAKLHELMAIANEGLFIGGFILCRESKAFVFRQTQTMRGSDGPTAEQVEELAGAALAACEGFFPASQFVIWGGKTPEEALQLVTFETVGEA